MVQRSANQRNALCPCNSGKKFKNCCLKRAEQIQEKLLTTLPVSSLPFAIRVVVEVDSHDGKMSTVCDYVPIICVGDEHAAVNFERTTNAIEANQIVRLGFCNYEARPLVQIRTNAGVFELACQEVLPDGHHEIIVTFDFAKERMRLLVDKHLRGESVVRGQLDFNGAANINVGFGAATPIWFGQIFRNTCDEEFVANYGLIRPTDLSQWHHFANGISRFFSPNEDRAIAYCCISRSFLSAMSKKNSLDARIVRLSGRDANEFSSRAALHRAALKTLKDVIEQLRLIVEDASSNEPALLAFFKANPVATVLLEPDTVRQWREAAIQNYGQIDFVLELADGTFRVVEIESAGREIFTERNEFTQSAQHAIEQTRKWIRGASKAPNTVVKRFGVFVPEVFLPSVVIGRATALKNDFCREVWHDEKKNLKLETWDDVLNRGEVLARRLNNPVLTDSEWNSE